MSLAFLVALARILPPVIRQGERFPPLCGQTSEDLHFQVIDDLTGKGLRRPLMRSLESLLWRELEEARANAHWSIEARREIGNSSDSFARLYRNHLRPNPSHFWALFAGGAIAAFQNFDHSKGGYSPEEYERQIRETLRSEYCDALLPGFESYRREKKMAWRRRLETASPLSSLRGADEDEEDFEERADWLFRDPRSLSERHVAERLAVRISLTPQQWREGLLSFSFDSAFLDRLAGQRPGWANKRRQRLVQSVTLSPRAELILAAEDALEATIAAERNSIARVAGLAGRSFPSAPPIPTVKKRAKEIPMQQNGHKPGAWRVWLFECHPVDKDGPQMWWAAQNGGPALVAPTPRRLAQKIRAYSGSR
jgi:hypothetical protein